MPTLDWIGKQAVIGHHETVPFRLLERVPELSVGDAESGNLLVQGDNLGALKALLPRYAGQVKLIYIDPPYNTGEENWKYNDNVNSPEIRAWLENVVGKEAEDLSRHDKWLCMMLPRLKLLHALLREDGVIAVSIDENEVAHLRLLLSEVFHHQNALGTLVWKRRSPSAMRSTPFSNDHEYVLIFARDATKVMLYGLEKGIESYALEDDIGRYASTDLTVGMGRSERPNQFYAIANPRTGREYLPSEERVWRFAPDTMKDVIAANLIIFPDETDGRLERPRYKTRYDPENARPKPYSSWVESASTPPRQIEQMAEDAGVQILTSGMNQEASRFLQQILGPRAFPYSKPLSLIEGIVAMATRGDDIVLDSFAGSGTTGHAVLKQNAADGGNRQFVLVEIMPEVAEPITKKRLEYAVAQHGGGFAYARLGETLFEAGGRIREGVSYVALAQHVYYSETSETLLEVKDGALLGVSGAGVAVYLLYNGVLKDKHAQGGNVLTRDVLRELPAHDGPRVIYGTANRLSADTMTRLDLTFKQIPYQIRVR